VVVGKAVVAEVAVGFAWTNVVWPLLPVAALAFFCILPAGYLLALTGGLEFLAGGRGLGLLLLGAGFQLVLFAAAFVTVFGGFIAGGVWLLRRWL